MVSNGNLKVSTHFCVLLYNFSIGGYFSVAQVQLHIVVHLKNEYLLHLLDSLLLFCYRLWCQETLFVVINTNGKKEAIVSRLIKCGKAIKYVIVELYFTEV